MSKFQIEGLPGGGQAFSKQHDALRAAIKERGDLFTGGGDDLAKTELAEGYSLTGGEGKVLVDSIQYKNSGNSGPLNVYRDENKSSKSDTPDEPAPAAAVAPNPEPKPEAYTESDQLAQAKERVQAWESSNAGTNPSPYGREKTDFESMVYGTNSNRDASKDQAQSQLDKFKAELKRRKS